jgi:hypothetical protein
MNLFTQFKRLLNDSPLLRAEVLTTAPESSTVRLPGGAELRVRGTAAVGAQVFVRDGAIDGTAPTLSITTLEV